MIRIPISFLRIRHNHNFFNIRNSLCAPESLPSPLVSSMLLYNQRSTNLDLFSNMDVYKKTCKLELESAAQNKNTVATLMRTLRGVMTSFPQTASEDLRSLKSAGKTNCDFDKQCEDLIKEANSILEDIEEVEEEGEGKDSEHEGGEQNDEAEQAETDGGENEGMEEEMNEEMQNILEYRLGQMLVIMNSIKFAQNKLKK